jgi:hypothetical protein
MTGKHPKRPRDPNQLAKSIIDIATGQKPDRVPEPLQPLSKKDVASLGGKKRATNLSGRRRAEIASKAARSRWKSKTTAE